MQGRHRIKYARSLKIQLIPPHRYGRLFNRLLNLIKANITRKGEKEDVMKKKLVAFAVTAAMVVSSAVPALAWSPVNTGPTMPVSNEVVMDSTHLQDGIVNEKNVAINDGDEHSITVDFNRTNGNFTYTLKMSGDQGAEFTKYVTINDSIIAVSEATLEGVQQTATPDGIATLTWRFVTVDGVRYVEFVVDEMSTPKEDATLTMKLDTNDKDEIEAVTVDSVEFTQWSGGNDPGWKAVIYQNQIPEEVTDVEVVLADNTTGEPKLDKYGRVQVVTQPVIGETYVVNSITLNDGTVITRDEIDLKEYVKLSWEVTKRDGTAMEILSNGIGIGVNSYGEPVFGIDAGYAGAYVTLTVTGNKDSGIFGETVWGDDMESLAIQQRIAGADRYETAMKVADQMKNAGSFDTIFVATGTNYADALSVTALANKVDAPILLVNAAHEDEVVQYIKKNVASYDADVYIVGGTSVVSADFEKELKKLTVNVDRLAGDNRYDTNIEVLKAFVYNEANGGIGTEKGTLSEVLVASGTGYADALSAASTGKPVLLVGGDALTKAQREFLYEIAQTKADRKYVVIGGRDAVSNDVKDEIASKPYTTAAVDRIGGVNRYETNMMVMDKYVKNDAAKYVFVASGMDYPDALTGGVLAAQNSAPLVLVNPNVTDPASDIVDIVADNAQYAGLVVIGGENAVSNATVQKIA